MRGADLHLAKMRDPLPVVWTWPGTDLAELGPTSVTVSRDPVGRWFVTFHADVPDPAPLPATGESAGVDLGLTDFAVLSTGERIVHPRHMDRHERRLKRYQRRLARCQKGSANRAKARTKVARAHARVADARRDFLHKASTDLVPRRWFPSSKTCSACGHLLASLSLSTRTWQCPSCGTRHDRDVNAAKNILAAAGLAAPACGADVRHGGATPVRSAVKQESLRATAGIPVLQGGE
jgi:putative transposase